MADASVVHIGENSPEKVALDLVQHIARMEGKILYQNRDSREQTADRKWLLDTYAECIDTVRHGTGARS